MHFVRWPNSQRQDPLAGRRCRHFVTVGTGVPLPALTWRRGRRWVRRNTPATIQGSRMRTKFEAVDKNGKLHKRAGVSRVYSHCVVIHFAAHPPSKFWPKGVTAYSRAQWAGTRELAERKASHWRKDAHVLELGVLEAR